MRFLVTTALVCILAWSSGGHVFGQNQSEEFIESSSPLPGGGRVISRSTPGNEIQTVASTAGRSNSVLDNRSSVLDRNTESETNRNSVFRQATPDAVDNTGANEAGGVASNAATNPQQRYPYPSGGRIGLGTGLQNSPRIARGGLLYPPVRASRTCNNCAVPFQLPTLGLTNGTATARQAAARQAYGNYNAQNCCTPQLGPTTTLQVPALQAPVLQLQPPASQVPTLANPQQNFGAFNPGFQNPGLANQPFATNPNLGVPQFGNQSNSFWSPFVTGSGVYQPIVRLANLRPGTYLGQGIVGQPTAYVDGQPVRNLLRYVFP